MIDIVMTAEFSYCGRCAMSRADRVTRWSTASAVLDVAAVASCEHAYDLCGRTARQAELIA
jgi:hypothetical protein